MIDWSEVYRKPTKKEVTLYKKWRKALSNSRLTKQEQHNRACYFTERLQEPNDE